MSALLSAEKLELAYGQVAVCRDISLSVEQGRNRRVNRRERSGEIHHAARNRGLAATAARLDRVLRARRDGDAFARAQQRSASRSFPEGRHVFPFLTVRENLELGGFKSRNDGAKIRRMIGEIFDMFPRLSERSTQNAGTLSGGEQQMLVLGRAMMSEPQLLCLDEPSLGLAPMVVQDIFRTIRAINAAGTSVLLVEQNARYALETASRGYVLQTGSVIASGTCADLKQNPRVQEAYLGRIAAAAVS